MRATVVVAIVCAATGAYAQSSGQTCTRDVECPGEEVCEQGRCALPSSAAPPAAYPPPPAYQPPAAPGPSQAPPAYAPQAAPTEYPRPPEAGPRQCIATVDCDPGEICRDNFCLSTMPQVQAVAPVRKVEAAPAPRLPKRFSLTGSPGHLIGLTLEATGEYRLRDKIGLAAILGVGAGIGGAGVYEVGAQGLYYLFGDFDQGAQIGLEVLRLGSAGSAFTGFGPLIGYKHSFAGGFTGQVQAGAQLQWTEGPLARANPSIFPIVNLNIGWSFGDGSKPPPPPPVIEAPPEKPSAAESSKEATPAPEESPAPAKSEEVKP